MDFDRMLLTHPMRQSGVTLVEVLVSLLIVAIGMLGVAGLFVASTRGAADSAYRSAASQAAYEIIDRIRANRDGLASYRNTTAISTTADPSPNCFSASCTPASLAAFETVVWAKSLTDGALSGIAQARAARLPNAQAVICQDRTPDDGTPTASGCDAAPLATDPWVVKIWWDERAVNNTERGAIGAPVIQRRFVMSFVP
ncbi:type IV pilus modification protein PilV [Niveibacterium sp.]|uniref:type IV pilus modification protein PilV n=1 Tax=Niveibacterium sp. TaxID=2017444 RepID=UPI0035ADB064